MKGVARKKVKTIQLAGPNRQSKIRRCPGSGFAERYALIDAAMSKSCRSANPPKITSASHSLLLKPTDDAMRRKTAENKRKPKTPQLKASASAFLLTELSAFDFSRKKIQPYGAQSGAK